MLWERSQNSQLTTSRWVHSVLVWESLKRLWTTGDTIWLTQNFANIMVSNICNFNLCFLKKLQTFRQNSLHVHESRSNFLAKIEVATRNQNQSLTCKRGPWNWVNFLLRVLNFLLICFDFEWNWVNWNGQSAELRYALRSSRSCRGSKVDIEVLFFGAFCQRKYLKISLENWVELNPLVILCADLRNKYTDGFLKWFACPKECYIRLVSCVKFST